jgi:2,3-bisphosphoglycerate-independent phosphoglycerate mutase
MTNRDRILRAMYDALQTARPFVYERVQAFQSLGHADDFERACEVLEAIDAALADAGDLLPGGSL